MHLSYHLFSLAMPLGLVSAAYGPSIYDEIVMTGPCYFNPGPGWALNASVVKTVYKNPSDQKSASEEFITITPTSSALFIFDIPNRLGFRNCGFKFVFPKQDGPCHDTYFADEWDVIRTNETLAAQLFGGKGCRADHTDRGGPLQIYELDPLYEPNNSTSWDEMHALDWHKVPEYPPMILREIEEDVVIIPRQCMPGKKVFRIDGLDKASYIFPAHGKDVPDPLFRWGRPAPGAYIVPCL